MAFRGPVSDGSGTRGLYATRPRSRRVHVTLVSRRFEDATAGGGAVSAALLVRLLRERGHVVDVLCAESSSADAGVARVPMTVRSLRARLSALRPDVVHADNLDAAPAAVIAARLARAPVAATVNGYTAVCLFGDQYHPTLGPCGPCTPSKIRGCFRDRPEWQIGRRVPAIVGAAETRRRQFLLGRADRLFARSASTRAVLVRCGVPAEKAVVVPNMRDPAIDGASSFEPRVLFVGKMDYPKGPDLLVEALASALPRAPGWSADFAGDGPLVALLRERTQALGIADRVRFHGFVPPAGMREIWSRASLLVTPVRWEEPFGRIVLEASAFGVPTLTADRGGHPEAIADGVDGRVVPPEDVPALADAIAALAADPSALRRMGAAAKAGLSRFDPARVLPRYEEEYARLARRRGRGLD